jgi:hypothetical protein
LSPTSSVDSEAEKGAKKTKMPRARRRCYRRLLRSEVQRKDGASSPGERAQANGGGRRAARAQRARSTVREVWGMREKEEEGAVSLINEREVGLETARPWRFARWAATVRVSGPPRGATLRVRRQEATRSTARIRNGDRDPLRYIKWARGSRREVTTATGLSVTVRMSLTSAGPEKFSTTSRRQLMARIPESETVNGMVCWIESIRLYRLRGLMLGDDPRYAKGMPNRMV